MSVPRFFTFSVSSTVSQSKLKTKKDFSGKMNSDFSRILEKKIEKCQGFLGETFKVIIIML